MRKIYLASESPARRQLLEIFGLKFKVVSSGAQEMDMARNVLCRISPEKRLLESPGRGFEGKERNNHQRDTIVTDGSRSSASRKTLKTPA